MEISPNLIVIIAEILIHYTHHALPDQLLLHRAHSTPILAPYPGDVSCDTHATLSKWAQVSFYYPLEEIFHRPCLVCQELIRKKECYSNFWGSTSENTISEIPAQVGGDSIQLVLNYLTEKRLDNLMSAEYDNSFEIIPEGFIKCSWLRTIESSGRVIRCKVSSCKYSKGSLILPITKEGVSYKDISVILNKGKGLFLYSPISNSSLSTCPFGLKGVDYCSIGEFKNNPVETFVCATNKALFQIDHTIESHICDLGTHKIFVSKTGEYVSRMVVSKSTNNVGHELTIIDQNTKLDIRRSISSLSELNYISNIIQDDTGNQYFFHNCLEFKQRWMSWALGYPSSCLAALALVSTHTYAGCKYTDNGILAYETSPEYVDSDDLYIDPVTGEAFYHSSSSLLYIIPYLGIITNRALNSSYKTAPLPLIYPLSDGKYWSSVTKQSLDTFHHTTHLQLLDSKPTFVQHSYLITGFTVPFSSQQFSDRWSNHTKDYKAEVLPLILPSLGGMFNTLIWWVIFFVILLILIKVMSLVLPSLSKSDRFKNLTYS
ncbi:glycoprotein [Hymenopteran rhabdo-related virus 23]|uniref:Glycoprotein n=1 Tax=Hymenopteran rhabdo-related virus 23 TaxID=2847804 RepID=A0AAE9GW05_9RHAB|nr:glycoprotein [Hymenopteran rhabdo-related virus]UOS86043.1 glycoprotein [Hymenopteran rhabdo-related virus 23]